MNPNAHNDQELREEFNRRFTHYVQVAGPLPSSDVIFELAKKLFGMVSFKCVLVGEAGVGKVSQITCPSSTLYVSEESK